MNTIVKKPMMIYDVPVLEIHNNKAEIKKPLVLVLHGGGGNKGHAVPLALELAAEGYFCVCPDMYNHGERVKPGTRLMGLSLIPQSAADINKILDYYMEYGNIDIKRVGMVGESMGGAVIFNYLKKHACRVKAIGTIVSTPKWEAVDYKAARLMMTDYLKTQGKKNMAVGKANPIQTGVLKLIQPIKHYKKMKDVAVLLMNGREDPIVKLDGVRDFYARMQKIIDDKSRVRMIEYSGIGHKSCPAMTKDLIRFFAIYLKA